MPTGTTPIRRHCSHRERVTGEGLTPDDRENTDDATNHRRSAADDHRRMHGFTGEEARLEDGCEQVSMRIRDAGDVDGVTRERRLSIHAGLGSDHQNRP